MARMAEEVTTEELLIQYDQEFDELCVKAAAGGGTAFLAEDTITHVLNELVALSLSARYTFMKIRYLQYKLAKEGKEKLDLNIAKDFKKGL
jgi:hypothetical protein